MLDRNSQGLILKGFRKRKKNGQSPPTAQKSDHSSKEKAEKEILGFG